MSAQERLAEEALYAHVAAEISAGVRRDGLWAKAIADSAGSKEAAQAKYIKLRVQSLIDEARVAAEIEKREADRHAEVARQSEKDAIERRVKEIRAREDAEHKENLKRFTDISGKVIYGVLAFCMAAGLLGAIAQVLSGLWFVFPVALVQGAILWWSVKKIRGGSV